MNPFKILSFNLAALRLDHRFNPSHKTRACCFQMGLVHVLKCCLNSGPKRSYIGMSSLISDPFDYAPKVIIERIQIWTVERPEFFRSKHIDVIREPKPARKLSMIAALRLCSMLFIIDLTILRLRMFHLRICLL